MADNSFWSQPCHPTWWFGLFMEMWKCTTMHCGCMGKGYESALLSFLTVALVIWFVLVSHFGLVVQTPVGCFDSIQL